MLLLSVFPMPEPVHAGVVSRAPNNLGLVGYWPLDEGKGSIAGDVSGNGRNGSLNGATWGTGRHYNALSFSGSAQSASTNYDFSWNNTNSVSISFWLKPKNITDYQTGVMGKQNPDWEWGFYQEYDHLKFVYWNTGGGHSNGMDDTWGSILRTGQWIYITYTWDGSTSRFYANGALVNTHVAVDPSINKNSTNSVMLGGNIYIWGDKYFNGSIDDVRFYNRTLVDGEISKLYSSGQATRKTVSNSGLVGYWGMDEGRGVLAGDSSSNNNSGSLLNGATWGSGKRAGAVLLNGSNSYVQVPSQTNLKYQGQDMTLSLWMKPDVAENDTARIISKPWNGCGEYNYVLTYESGKTLTFSVRGSTNYDMNSNGAVAERNVWNHIVATVDSSKNMNIYINGALANSATHNITAWTPVSCADGNVSLAIGTLYPYGAGWGGNTGFSFKGLMDDTRIYNRVLSAAEIQAMYKQGSATIATSYENRLTDGLVGLWTFNGKDISGSTVLDKSGQGNNGTITGATTMIGKLGQAMSFNDANNSVISIPDIVSASTTGAYSFWVKPSSTNASQGWIDSTFDIFQWSGSSLYFRAGNQSAVSINGWTPNTWHHVAMVWNGSKYYGYLDGEQVTEGIQSGNRSGAISLGKVDAGFYYNGGIDEVRIYNKALSASDIKQLYNLGK